MAAFMGWVTSQRRKAGNMGAPNRLSHPKAILIIGLAGFVLFLGLAVVSNLFPNDTVSWWTTVVFLGFATLSGLLIAEYYRARHEYSEEGLRFSRLFGSGGYLRWNMLSSVKYSHAMKWFRLQAHSGEVARISAYQSGLPNFARTLLEHAPLGTIDSETLGILKETSEGHPPALW